MITSVVVQDHIKACAEVSLALVLFLSGWMIFFKMLF
jgi:hypothetical protein